MSKFLVYIKVEPYLRQWLQNSFGDPVEFPANSNENAVLRRFTSKRPGNINPEQPTEEMIGICIPASKYKNPETYNYMSESAKQALAESISDLFRMNLWKELGDLSDTSCKKMTAFRSWCCMHGIDVEYAETVRMKWYRMLKSYQKHGINLFSHKDVKRGFLGKNSHLPSTLICSDTHTCERMRTDAHNIHFYTLYIYI